MLELKNIVKDYVSSNNVTHALKGISVSFRTNEFVSILGASGCGKTTTLNIIGGLDRYTSGDLLINGTSTKNYNDRDWDTYRNHSIGFIFQTYNLIAHQNILKNVELALTISGVSEKERKQRAMEALAKVGLAGMEKKKPNQLSGGQCQRVAIARALVNNPEILLADEPTGALDSETSVQIMDLLKEVASDRLVIMVTHNPELAYKYSTRIIKMSDGLLIEDSMPFDGKEEVKKVEVVNKGNKKKTSMSLATATGLSLANLFSKIKRTVLVTIAGSIGIIGVSAVLGVSRGVKDYIADLQNDMLSGYPVEIAEETVDLSSLMSGLNNDQKKELIKFDPRTEVGVNSMINYLMSSYDGMSNRKTNKINEQLLDYIDSIPSGNAAVISKDYGIDVTNNIFTNWKQNKDEVGEVISLNGLTQSYIAELKTLDGFGTQYASFVNLFTNFMHEMPDNKNYILNQYDVVAGSTLNLAKDELVLVVDRETTLTDLLLAQIGMYDRDSFIKIAQKSLAISEAKKKDISDAEKLEEIEKINADVKYKYETSFKMEDLLNKPFYYYPHSSIYSNSGHVADDETNITFITVITDGDGKFSKLLYLQYDTENDLLMGIEMNKESETNIVVMSRTGEKTSDALTKEILYGNWTGFSTSGTSIYGLSLSETVNTFSENFGVPNSITPSIEVTTTTIDGYHYPAIRDNSWSNGIELKIGAILRIKDTKQFGSVSSGLYYSKAFTDQFIEDSKNAPVTEALSNHIKLQAEHNLEKTPFNAYVTFDYMDHKNGDVVKSSYASSLNVGAGASFGEIFSSITGVDYEELNSKHLRSLSGLKAVVEKDENGVFESYSTELYPESIDIYPYSFDCKNVITKHLDKWNSEQTLMINGVEVKAEDRDSLTYNDNIEIIVAVINTFIEAITIALVVFTSLSLVVSCFMIAVITYISVVERIKEIGVIRSLGGRKSDVANLFIMETLLTGLFSGLFGVIFTYIIQIILNAALVTSFGVSIMHLTISTAFVMICISVGLSVLSGLIPSQSAARKDPVNALRSAD